MVLNLSVSLFPVLCVLVLAVCAQDLQSADQTAECPATDAGTLSRLVTKTPYRLVANRDQSPIEYPGCQATRIWSVIRHGTRRPNRRFLRSMTEHLPAIRDRLLQANALCGEQLQLLRSWSPPAAKAADEMSLMPEGEEELRALAERMQNRFPQLMPDEYRNESYRFKFTDTQRTRRSFEEFATGLFGRNNIGGIWWPQPMHRDPVLRFYKRCARWSAEVDKNPRASLEVDAFRHSPQMQAAVRSISERAGLQNPLTDREAHLLYTVCAFETAWDRHQPSAWCSLFDEPTAAVFEYLEDLDYYHIDGYATPLTYQQACPALDDMLQRVLSTDEPPVPAATFYFTHSGTILKLLALLGLYRDAEPLRADNFEQQQQRQWRTSRIDAFASNLAFVLYNCSGSNHLLVQHQERTVQLPGCPTDSDLCPIAQFRSLYRHSLGDKCRFDEICALPNSADRREEL